MAQLGVRCVRGDMTHDECRACAQDSLHPCGYPPELLEMLRPRSEPGEPSSGQDFSPSRLLGCARRAVLEDEEDHYTDIDTAYYALRGTLMHSGCEKLRHPILAMAAHGAVPNHLLVVREQRIQTTVATSYGPQPFSAKADCVVVRRVDLESGTVHVLVRDYKTRADIGHDLVRADPEHQMQVNMYAWLVAKELPGLFGAAVVVDELEINYLGASKVRRFTSAGPLRATGPMVKRKPPSYRMLDLEPIQMLEPERVERFIRARIEARLADQLAGRLPAVLPAEDRWVCRFCPVYAQCMGRAKADGQDGPVFK